MKLEKSIFNEYTGESIVVLENKGKKYQGHAILHPEDFENASKYAGCRIAEKRALIKYYKEKRDEAKIKLKAIQSLKSDLSFAIAKEKISPEVWKRICIHEQYWSDAYTDYKQFISASRKQIEKEIKIRERLLKRTKQNN